VELSVVPEYLLRSLSGELRISNQHLALNFKQRLVNIQEAWYYFAAGVFYLSLALDLRLADLASGLQLLTFLHQMTFDFHLRRG
jgi:hypothetical protein